MFVPLGKTATVEELLKGIIVQSGNDAAISIAENMKGSEALFAEAMTDEARRLGLKKSVFKNATGLPHPEHVMTMREIAILARHIIKEYPEYYPMFAQKEFLYRRHKFYQPQPAARRGGRRGRPQDRVPRGRRATASSPRPSRTTGA